MKLTKQKLEQLITEEYKSMSRRVFDKRREFPKGGTIRAFGDEDQPINRPEFHDKLTTLAGDDFNQARELADSLGEPLDIKFDPSNMETFEIDSPFGNHLQSPEYQLHWDFLMDSRASALDEEPDIGEIYEFSQEQGLDPEDTRKKIMDSYEFIIRHLFTNSRFRFSPAEEVRKLFPGTRIYESKK